MRHHLTSIFDKLDVPNRLELVLYAYRHRLAKPLFYTEDGHQLSFLNTKGNRFQGSKEIL